MSRELRIAIEGYVEHCIKEKAQEKYIIKLNAELDEIEDKATRYDEKETPYNPIARKLRYVDVNAYTFDAYCRCGYKINDSFRYCPNCSQRLDFKGGQD